jgi:glyoxylase-like metal-dependent hydrolase (beta-lactamase superfamily II)
MTTFSTTRPVHRLACLSRVILALIAALSFAATAATPPAPDAPELAYLKVVNQWRPPSDPTLLFLLAGQFANGGRAVEGIRYFEDTLRRFGPQLDDTQRALYLTAIANLRAVHANDVFVLKRPAWVRDTLAMLDEAKRLTKNDAFIVHWMSGVVRSRIPALFGERDAAYRDLAWCMQHADGAPNPGFLREVYAQLGTLERERGNVAEAGRLLSLGGESDASHAAATTITTAMAGGDGIGYTFSPRAITEVVPGSVYALSGFEFTEYYFIISADRSALIAIDAGTRPDAAQQAYLALQARVPSLPPLTTVFITHAHWDHVGGQAWFRSLNPKVRFYGRANYRDEIALDGQANPATLQRFFGSKFHLDDVLRYKPDVTITAPTEVEVGGTRFSLLPTRGGETDDAMLIHMPVQGVLFVGDIMMPYLGAPFVAEGSVDGMLAAIGQVHALHPAHILHGHAPLTRIFSSVAMLDDLEVQLAWLRTTVLHQMAAGAQRGQIQQANLIPPTLANSRSDVDLAYLLLRENAINRLYQQHSGYWRNGMHGLDALTDADNGAALVDYLNISAGQVASAVERLNRDGKHEMAARLLSWVQPRLPNEQQLRAAHRSTYLKLMEKYQDFNPFKFIMYHEQIELPLPQLTVAGAPAPAPQQH